MTGEVRRKQVAAMIRQGRGEAPVQRVQTSELETTEARVQTSQPRRASARRPARKSSAKKVAEVKTDAPGD